MTEFKKPTPEQVQQTLRKIPTLQLRRVFYSGNKNPLWVRPLLDAGAFINPPEPTVDDKGLIREQPWPEIGYLKDMAPHVPGDVVDVLLTVKDSTNSWIRRSVFEIGATIPADQAARIVPIIKEWDGANTGLGFRSDPHNQALMLRNLLDNGQYKAGMQLATILLEPRAGNEHVKVVTNLEDYWYAEELPEIIKSMGQMGIGPICRWLLEYERLDGRLSDKSDFTFMDRSIIDRADTNHGSIRQALIDGLLSLSIENIEKNPEKAIPFLLKRRAVIVMRVALFAANQALRKLTEDKQDSTAVMTAARGLLRDPICTDSVCRVEYAQLVQTMYAINPSALDELPAIIEAGPFGDPGVFRDKLEKDAEENKTVEEKLVERTEYWRHRLLAAIGSESLPESLQENLRELDEKIGTIAEPLSPFMSTSTSWVGPTSPMSKDDFTVMSAEEIIDHLETWKPKDSWNSPSHEGQAREITGLLTTNPMMISGVDGLIDRLRPTYLSAIFRGWEAAIKADIAPNWQQLITTAAAVLAHGDESSYVQEGRDFDDEPNYKNAKQSAEGMLEELAKKRDGLKVPEDVMESIANLILDTDTESAWQDYLESAGASSMDPLTISLNYRWPIHFRSIIMLLTHGSGTPWYNKALAALDNELARDDVIGSSRAILGERLGNLSYFAPEWLAAHKEEILGTESSISASQQITLTTTLATSGYYNDAFDLVRSSLLAATKQISSLTAGWEANAKPDQLIGRWVVHAFIWGHLDYDDEVLQSFYTNASPETRGDVIGHIAWAFMRADKVAPELVPRLGELWDLRVAHVKEHPEDKDELNDFFWFIRSGKYAPDWWLPRLVEAAELHGDLNTQGMIGEILADAAKDHPREALDALRLLLTGDPDDDGMRYDLTEHAAPATIAAGLMSSDASVVNDAKDYMNKLGAGGYIDLENRVNSIVDGSRVDNDNSQ